MSDRVRTGVVGLGKMGLSHFALVNPHPLAEAYRSGNTQINPTNCLYCDQAALCRKHESTVRETGGD